MQNLVNDTNTKINGVAKDFKNKLGSMDNSLESSAHEIGVKIGSLASGLASSATDYTDASRDYVKANPFKGILMAATTGALAGSLLTMLFRRKH